MDILSWALDIKPLPAVLVMAFVAFVVFMANVQKKGERTDFLAADTPVPTRCTEVLSILVEAQRNIDVFSCTNARWWCVNSIWILPLRSAYTLQGADFYLSYNPGDDMLILYWVPPGTRSPNPLIVARYPNRTGHGLIGAPFFLPLPAECTTAEELHTTMLNLVQNLDPVVLLRFSQCQ